MQQPLPKSQMDALLILHFKIERSIAKEDIEALIRRGLVDKIGERSWRVNGAGRAMVRKMV